MALGDLLLRLRMDTADLESDSGRAAHIVERDMETMIVKATAAGQLIGDALGKMAVKFGELITSTINLGETFDKASQRTGFAIERLSELKYAGDLADVSFSQITTSLGFFNKALAEAENESSKVGQTFMAMGVDITQGPQAAFEQFIKSVNQLPDQESKVAAMRIAFGRAGDALLPMIGNLDEATERARKLGIVMSEDLARDSARFNDAMKTLHATSQALLLPTLTKDAQAFATIAENIVKATEKGEKWKQLLIEIDKVAIATFGALVPGFDKLAEEQFKYYQRKQDARDHGATGDWGDKPAGPAPNPEAVACAVSGGKWVNGECQRGGAGGRAKDMTAENERAAREQVAGEKEAAKETADAWKSWEDIQLKQYKEMEDAKALATKQMLEQIDADQARAIEDGRLYLQALEKEAKKSRGFMEELGFTMVSAFENAIVSGKNLSGVLQSLAQDIAKVILRKNVINPLGDALGSAFKGIFSNDEAGATQLAGPRASGGPVMPGSTYLVGERGPELLHMGGAGMITPNSALGGGGGVNIAVTVNADSQASGDEISMKVAQVMRSIAQNEIAQQLRPGGALR